jgi:hypothetical protein
MRGSCRIQRKGLIYETGSRLLPGAERGLRNMDPLTTRLP